MGGLAVIVAALAGAAVGAAAAPLADRIGLARYGPDTEGHDPEDEALAPLTVPSTTSQRIGLGVVAALAFAALAWQLPRGDVVAYFALLLAAYLTAMVVDLQWLRLPNVFTYPAAVLAVAGGLALSDRHGLTAVGLLVGGLFYPGVLLVLRVAYQLLRGREGMGLGDIKLAVSLGASAGWLGGVLTEPAPGTYAVGQSPVLAALAVTIYAVMAGNLLGAVVGAAALRRVDREIPFGPALVGGWLLVVLVADSIVA